MRLFLDQYLVGNLFVEELEVILFLFKQERIRLVYIWTYNLLPLSRRRPTPGALLSPRHGSFARRRHNFYALCKLLSVFHAPKNACVSHLFRLQVNASLISLPVLHLEELKLLKLTHAELQLLHLNGVEGMIICKIVAQHELRQVALLLVLPVSLNLRRRRAHLLLP